LKRTVHLQQQQGQAQAAQQQQQLAAGDGQQGMGSMRRCFKIFSCCASTRCSARFSARRRFTALSSSANT